MKEQSLLKHFMIIGGGAVINMLIGLITTPLITRLVDPTDYGQLSLFNTYSNIIMMIFCLGLDQSLVRYFYKQDSEEYKRTVLFKCWFYPVIVFCICAALGLIYVISTGKAKTQNEICIVILFVINVIALLLNRFSTLILRLTKKSNLYSAMNILHKIFYVLITLGLVMVYQSHYFQILAFATVMASVIPAAVGIIVENKMWNPFSKRYSGKIEYIEMIKYGIPLVVANGIYMIFQAIDKICLSHFCSYADVGVYASAMSLMSIIAILRTTFNTIWAPVSVERYEKNPEEKEFFKKGNRYITVIMFAFGITLMLAKDLIAFLLGEKYRSAAMIMPFLLFQPIMYTVSETTVIGIYFKNKSYAQLIVSGAACIFNIIGNIILIPLIGAKGAAVSTGLSYILFFTLRTVFSNKFYYVDFGLKKFYFVTFLTVLYALYNTFVPFNWLSVVLYIILAIVGCTLYRETIKELILIAIDKISILKKRGKQDV